jgi:hypothetical protein
MVSYQGKFSSHAGFSKIVAAGWSVPIFTANNRVDYTSIQTLSCGYRILAITHDTEAANYG